MIKKEDIISRLEANPFRSFRMSLTNGQTVDVTHPDQVMVFPHKLIVGIGRDATRSFDRDIHCAMLHIASIEELQAA